MLQHSETESEPINVSVVPADGTPVHLCAPDLADTIRDYAEQVPQIQSLLAYGAKGLQGTYRAVFTIRYERVDGGDHS